MKKTIIVNLLLISCLHTTTFSDSEISGLWGGFGVQDSGSAWTIKMLLNDNKYLIEYPSIPCGGKLQLLSHKNNQYVFHEMITHHKKNCINNGKLVLTLIDSNTLDWKWHDPNDSSITATRVKRYPNLQAYNARVPLMLEKYKREKQKYTDDTNALGIALGAAAVYGLYKLFSGNGDSSTSSYSSSSSYTPPSYDPCNSEDICFRVIESRTNGAYTDIHCTKGYYTGQKKCLGYNRNSGKYSAGCGITEAFAHHYTFKEAGYRACK